MRFADVADAVDYCQRLVPHVVSRFEDEPGANRAVVWFHVPLGDDSMRGGCLLFLSATAVEAARLAALPCSTCHVVGRGDLPRSSVLVFGDDQLDPPTPTPQPVRRIAGSRVTALAADLRDLDTVLR